MYCSEASVQLVLTCLCQQDIQLLQGRRWLLWKPPAQQHHDSLPQNRRGKSGRDRGRGPRDRNQTGALGQDFQGLQEGMTWSIQRWICNKPLLSKESSNFQRHTYMSPGRSKSTNKLFLRHPWFIGRRVPKTRPCPLAIGKPPLSTGFWSSSAKKVSTFFSQKS